MENITILPTGGRLSSKMRRHLERGNLMTRRRLEEHIRQSEIKALENIIDQAFGLETEPRKVLTIQRKPANDSINVIASFITQVKDSVEIEPDNINNTCLPRVSLYRAGYRQSTTVTARG
ncbi:hypothetical protein PSI22_20700 [Xenorhabdus sp. XENO-7]|uniref:Uncharacterized protein n=1 Tax=Xenorhabdus aichiensis TaxID=3025874 RepID=A0ABT5MCM6_9GAMM|nr:hypothetical protein [Xenorhabdus aichiensis]MDC9623982.1 hypothetical protein [Xenorhabdus aichiensis]